MSDANSNFLARRWSRFGLVMGLFTVLGLIDAGQIYMHVRRFSDWYLWAALSPLIFYLARRFPLTAARWRSRLLIHFYFGSLLVLLKIALDMLLNFVVIGKSVMFLPLSAEERLQPNYE
jgi:hypothetical protein